MCAMATHPHTYTLIKEHNFRKLFRGLHHLLPLHREGVGLGKGAGLSTDGGVLTLLSLLFVLTCLMSLTMGHNKGTLGCLTLDFLHSSHWMKWWPRAKQTQ